MRIDFKNMGNTIDMRSFELIAETSTVDEFKSLILNLKGKKIDETNGRVEKFDFKNIGNFYEDTVENYLRELSSIKPIKKEKISELIKDIKAEDLSSREILMEGSLKLVAKTALYYSKVGASYIELVQDGLIGIVKAIENYDLDCPIEFLEYMEFWIKYEMIQSNKLVVEELKSPIIAYFKNMKVEVYKSENKGVSSDMKETNAEDIKKVLNMDIEEFENLQKINDYGFLIKKEDKEEAEVYRSIPEIDIRLAKVEKLMSVSNLANKFTVTEIKILDLFYGLSGKRKYFEEIGEILDMKPSKVKAEVEKLMIKLKYNGKKEWIDEN
ncbi:MAG: sigma-70 family RNA polymerase sigma factor [Psychrilyobacter sp.]|uniref:sigma-70 family RNA polymerase sigma factor n=1 Tax=Psychrilyobacter sp. TaxID=2586924 RepID=UPI003C72F0C2